MIRVSWLWRLHYLTSSQHWLFKTWTGLNIVQQLSSEQKPTVKTRLWMSFLKVHISHSNHFDWFWWILMDCKSRGVRMPVGASNQTPMHFDILFGVLKASIGLICIFILQFVDALGCFGMFRDVSGCFGMLRDPRWRLHPPNWCWIRAILSRFRHVIIQISFYDLLLASCSSRDAILMGRYQSIHSAYLWRDVSNVG